MSYLSNWFIKHFTKQTAAMIAAILLILQVTTFTLFYINQEALKTCKLARYSCQNLKVKDLPTIENLKPRTNSIFFHKLSCEGRITKREACVLESAARVNPGKQIYVLFGLPVTDDALGGSSLKILRTYADVHFTTVDLEEYVKKTPLENIVHRNLVNKRKWRMKEDEVLKILSLYKFGGVYLDMDVLVVRPLTPLGDNYIAMENKTRLSKSVLAISMNKAGRKFIDAIFK